MNRLRLRVKIDPDEKGIFLDKLETLVAELRKFLASYAADLQLHDPNARWKGSDFRNGSLAYTAEYPLQVPAIQHNKFNAGIAGLVQRKREPFVSQHTASNFYGIPGVLEQKDKLKLGVFNGGGGVKKWMAVDRALGSEAVRKEATSRYVGGAQGIIHSLFKESEPQYFQLRELSTDTLIKCYYTDEMYAEIVDALKSKNRVIIVQGEVCADLGKREIESIKLEKLKPMDAYGFRDVQKFLHPHIQ